MTITFLIAKERVEIEISGKRENQYWFRGEYYVRCSDGLYREQSDATRYSKRHRVLLMPESERQP